MPTPATLSPFEAPLGTLFLLDPRLVRIITLEGQEALIPTADLFAFLVHLSLVQATAYTVLEPLRRWLEAFGVQVPDLES